MIPSRKLLLILSFLTAFLSLSAKEKDYVLLLNSINEEEPWVNNFSKELRSYFNEHPSLDLKSFQLFVPILKTREEVTLLLQKLLNTYPVPPKAVVIIGDPGWLVTAPVFDGPWKDIPIILCYSRQRVPSSLQTLLDKVPLTPQNSIPISEFNKKYNVTVLRQPYYIPQTLKLIRHLQPDVKKVALVADERYISVVTRQEIQMYIQKEHPDLAFEPLSALTTEQLLDTLSTYDKTVAVIYYSWFRQYGNKNSVYLSDHIRKILPTFLKVPVYTLADLNLHENLFAGGHYISIKDFTVTTVSLLQRILSGVPASSIPYQDGGTPRTYLNYADLQWCSIPESLYPANAVYFFKPPTFYQRYKIYIWMTGVFLALLLTLYLLYHIRSQKSKRELIKAKERAEEADRLKSAFLANMSHEIRTPLNAIVGFSNVLVTSECSPEEQKEFVDVIQTNSDLLLRLINDILDISRLETGKLKFSYEECDVASLGQMVLATTSYSKKQGVEYIFNPCADSYIIETDVQRLQQVMINLLSNANKFTTSGSITLAFEEDESHENLIFSVTDTGTGIPEEKQQKVFERFEKLDEYVQGTGLGLAICKITINMLGGKIWIDSTYKQGARFVFTHPIKRAEG